jgi:hypothetical protein
MEIDRTDRYLMVPLQVMLETLPPRERLSADLAGERLHLRTLDNEGKKSKWQ